MDENTIFRVTFEDVEMILGRKLEESEKIIVRSKFDIEDWSDHVDMILDIYIRGKK